MGTKCTYYIFTNGGFEFGRVCIAGDRDDNLHIVGGGPALELRLGLHHDLDPTPGFLVRQSIKQLIQWSVFV